MYDQKQRRLVAGYGTQYSLLKYHHIVSVSFSIICFYLGAQTLFIPCIACS
ncbi:hypothetical protein DsansV1_C04g0038271 [Dioscorea sansibarensis]